MPLVSTEAETQYWEPLARGPVAQLDLSVAMAPTSTIALSSNYTTRVINGDGYGAIACGVTSSQAGAINIQRYLDAAGTIKQGAVSTVAVAAATPVVLNVGVTAGDNLPYRSFTVQITNTSGTTAATVTNFALLLIAE